MVDQQFRSVMFRQARCTVIDAEVWLVNIHYGYPVIHYWHWWQVVLLCVGKADSNHQPHVYIDNPLTYMWLIILSILLVCVQYCPYYVLRYSCNVMHYVAFMHVHTVLISTIGLLFQKALKIIPFVPLRIVYVIVLDKDGLLSYVLFSLLWFALFYLSTE